MTADRWPPPGRHPGWPAKLSRALRDALRGRDQAAISPWDATSGLSWADRHNRAQWHAHRSLLLSAARRGEVLPFVITLGGAFVGQITIGGIQRGALRSGWVGYWVDSTSDTQGVATAAVALTVAHGFGPVGLHRIEATVAPENVASRAVVAHLGFRQEGHLVRYLDIAGTWRDHLLYALTVEEVPRGLPQLLHTWRSESPGAGRIVVRSRAPSNA